MNKNKLAEQIRRSRRKLCRVCRLDPAVLILCKACQRSYDRSLAEQGEAIGSLIEWAARRAWRFAIVSVEAKRAADVIEQRIDERIGARK